MSDTIEIPERAGWYLRSIVHRGLNDLVVSTLHSVESLAKYDDSEVAGSIREAVENMGHYNLQLAREAIQQFEQCPPEAVGDEYSFRAHKENVERLAAALAAL